MLIDHLNEVARLAGLRGAKFGFAAAAIRAGLLHDLGKFTARFQRRLEGGASLDHATAGAQEIMRLVKTPRDRVIAELIAYVIAGHHTGLADRDEGKSSLSDRLEKAIEPLDPVWRDVIQPDAIDLVPSFDWVQTQPTGAFQLAFLGRMLFSCLVDADHRDTDATRFRALSIDKTTSCGGPKWRPKARTRCAARRAKRRPFISASSTP